MAETIHNDVVAAKSEAFRYKKRAKRLRKKVSELHLQRKKSDAIYLDMCRQNDFLRTQLATHRWIPVGERLPKESGRYRVTDGRLEWHTHYKVEEFNPDGWWKQYSRTITHWKPITLPKENE